MRDAALETGFLRCRPEGRLELLLTHNTGFVEIWYGEAEPAKFELATDAVVRTESAKEYVAGNGSTARRGRPALRLRHGGDGPGAPAAHLGEAAAANDRRR